MPSNFPVDPIRESLQTSGWTHLQRFKHQFEPAAGHVDAREAEAAEGRGIFDHVGNLFRRLVADRVVREVQLDQRDFGEARDLVLEPLFEAVGKVLGDERGSV